jgi:DNA-binding response OmpR family regulator
LALVIEDSNVEAAIYDRALQAAGFETEVISSGDDALARLAIVVPDVVVLDLNLPGVDGADILRHIRADARLAETRVIVATAEPQAARTLREEADLVLIKPVNFAQLRDLSARLGTTT